MIFLNTVKRSLKKTVHKLKKKKKIFNGLIWISNINLLDVGMLKGPDPSPPSYTSI